jgi:pyruvate formate lyase activating enzyme
VAFRLLNSKGMATVAEAQAPARIEALLWETRPDGSVVCHLCAHRCRIRPGLRGICGVRQNVDGRLVTLVADRVVAAEVDPIEKKPFFHFLPGCLAYSIATVGCNLHCLFCQNWAISQWPREASRPVPGDPTSPRAIVAAARAAGCAAIAYTYTEPTIFFELALETSRLAVEAGLRNVFVTNGYMTSEALALIASVLHGANVDLKSFSDRYYRKVCGATLRPVLETIQRMRERSIWVEVTTLLIPGRNDGDEELTALAQWLASVDRDMPWHVSAFYPAYKMTDVPPTPVETLHRAARIGRQAGLRYVYSGNVPGDPLENTACPECGRWLLRRRGFTVTENRLEEGRCPVCKTVIAGVFT